MTKITIDAAFLAKPTSEQIRLMSAAMREINPEKYDAAASSVRKNMQRQGLLDDPKVNEAEALPR